MLTDDQDQVLERLQASALRCIYRYQTPYSKMRQLAEVSTLRERRVAACDKFANKCLGSKRFSKWFPLKTGRRGRSGAEIYIEEYAPGDRLRNSPVFYIRRRLNGKIGKKYGKRNKEYREGNRISEQMNPARGSRKRGRNLTDGLQ